jgi:amino acid transporter
MAELASAMPTAGGIYYWSSKLGGAGWGWFTGWFNLIGLVAVTASVDYAAATFLNSTLSFYGLHLFGVNFATSSVQASLHHTFVLFALILIAHGLINIFSSPLVALFPVTTRASASSLVTARTSPALTTTCTGSTYCPWASC